MQFFSDLISQPHHPPQFAVTTKGNIGRADGKDGDGQDGKDGHNGNDGHDGKMASMARMTIMAMMVTISRMVVARKAI